MKRADFLVLAVMAAVALTFAAAPPVLAAYLRFNAAHGMVMSFIKFAILATFGEALALRISEGVYNRPGFGIACRALVWGGIGVLIKTAFILFAGGAPAVLVYLGVNLPADVLKQDFSPLKLLTAFSISASMNLIFAPVFMTLHKVTDEHIRRTGGRLGRFFTPIAAGDILASLDWSVLWHFVFKKTIPLFWIPAHTLVFLMPADFRILAAAVLSVVLGVLLAVANLNKGGAPQPAASR